MADPVSLRAWVIMADDTGNTTRVSTYIPWTGSGAATLGAALNIANTLQSALKTVSNAAIRSWGIEAVGKSDNGELGASAVYSSVIDKAEFRYATTGIQQYQLTVPAPQEQIFNPDGITVNLGLPIVGGFTGWITTGGNACTNAQEGIQGILSAYRTSRKRRLRPKL